jgi:hypothetical protein
MLLIDIKYFYRVKTRENKHTQLREEVKLTAGRFIVRGNKGKRDDKSIRFADYVLYLKPNLPLAIVEAKDNKHTVRDGISQPLFEQVRQVLNSAQQQARQSINDVMVQSYWQIGHLIVEDEQGGAARAEYGKQTLK